MSKRKTKKKLKSKATIILDSLTFTVHDIHFFDIKNWGHLEIRFKLKEFPDYLFGMRQYEQVHEDTYVLYSDFCDIRGDVDFCSDFILFGEPETHIDKFRPTRTPIVAGTVSEFVEQLNWYSNNVEFNKSIEDAKEQDNLVFWEDVRNKQKVEEFLKKFDHKKFHYELHKSICYKTYEVKGFWDRDKSNKVYLDCCDKAIELFLDRINIGRVNYGASKFKLEFPTLLYRR